MDDLVDNYYRVGRLKDVVFFLDTFMNCDEYEIMYTTVFNRKQKLKKLKKVCLNSEIK